MSKNGLIVVVSLILIMVFSNLAMAATYYVCGTGLTWNATPTFAYTSSDCTTGGPVSLNSLGVTDVLVIQPGAVITVSGNRTLAAVRLEVYGTLYFDKSPAGKITMNTTGASIVLYPGSVLACLDNFGGETSCSNSNQIEIDGVSFKGTVLDDADALPKPSTIDQGGPMPVDLMFFNGYPDINSVNLTWATASEENFDYFSIERSADGSSFIEIAQVSGAGYSMERLDYSYVDEFPLQGNSYYRLRSIDYDGYTEIFDYVMVNVEDQADKFSIYPNPIENTSFKVQTNFATEEPMQLLVYNNMGMVEKTYVVNDWLGSYSSSSLQQGTYVFKLIGREKVLVQRVLIK